MGDSPAEVRQDGSAPLLDERTVELTAADAVIPEAAEAGGRLDRRLLLKGLGAGLVGVSLAPLLAACSSSNNNKTTKAPVGAAPAGGTPVINIEKGAQLNILLWNHFVPAYDVFFDKFAADWGKANNVNVRVDHVDISQLPGRLAAEVASRKGHDLFAFEAQVQTIRYQNYLVNVDSIMNPLIKLYGDVIPLGKSTCQVNGAWLGIPSFNVLIMPMLRRDLVQANGLKAPQTWNDVMAIGKVMKPKGHPCGMAISHCNDANHNWRAVMWSFGANEVHEDGKTLALDTQEMKDFLTFAKEFQATANSDEVYAWVDVSDNQYLQSGTGVMIHDAISSIVSLKGKDDALYNNIDILNILSGPKKRLMEPDPQVWGMWNFQPKQNLEAASAFLWYFMNHFKETFTASSGYNMPMFANLLKKPMPLLSEDPKYTILQDFTGDLLQTFGYPGPPNAPAEQVLSQYIIPDMVAKVKGSGTVDDALKWAREQLTPIYAKNAKLEVATITPTPAPR